MAEKRILVTSIDELTPGVRIVFTSCDACGQVEHEGMILGESDGATWSVMGLPDAPARAREVVPMPPCCALVAPWMKFVVTEFAVAQRVVYRLDDGIDPAADAEQDARDQRDARLRSAGAVRTKYTFIDGELRVERELL